jgi:shikimate dehydrogenase
MDDLKTLRDEIDQLDDSIMKLLQKRFDLSIKVGNYKSINNIQVTHGDREKEIITKISKYSHYPSIEHVYKTILHQSKSLQRR